MASISFNSSSNQAERSISSSSSSNAQGGFYSSAPITGSELVSSAASAVFHFNRDFTSLHPYLELPPFASASDYQIGEESAPHPHANCDIAIKLEDPFAGIVIKVEDRLFQGEDDEAHLPPYLQSNSHCFPFYVPPMLALDRIRIGTDSSSTVGSSISSSSSAFSRFSRPNADRTSGSSRAVTSSIQSSSSAFSRFQRSNTDVAPVSASAATESLTSGAISSSLRTSPHPIRAGLPSHSSGFAGEVFASGASRSSSREQARSNQTGKGHWVKNLGNKILSTFYPERGLTVNKKSRVARGYRDKGLSAKMPLEERVVCRLNIFRGGLHENHYRGTDIEGIFTFSVNWLRETLSRGCVSMKEQIQNPPDALKDIPLEKLRQFVATEIMPAYKRKYNIIEPEVPFATVSRSAMADSENATGSLSESAVAGNGTGRGSKRSADQAGVVAADSPSAKRHKDNEDEDE